MMKEIQKFISLLFALLIFASQSGMAFNLHYCKGALASITLGLDIETCRIEGDSKNAVKKCCEKKKDISHKKCCKNSKIDLKEISSDDVISKSLNLDLPLFYLSFEYTETILNIIFVPSVISKFYTYIFASHAPPFYKLYCQYIIYA